MPIHVSYEEANLAQGLVELLQEKVNDPSLSISILGDGLYIERGLKLWIRSDTSEVVVNFVNEKLARYENYKLADPNLLDHITKDIRRYFYGGEFKRFNHGRSS